MRVDQLNTSKTICLQDRFYPDVEFHGLKQKWKNIYLTDMKDKYYALGLYDASYANCMVKI